MDPLDATNATEPIVDTTFDVYGLINNQCVWGPTPSGPPHAMRPSQRAPSWPFPEFPRRAS